MKVYKIGEQHVLVLGTGEKPPAEISESLVEEMSKAFATMPETPAYREIRQTFVKSLRDSGDEATIMAMEIALANPVPLSILSFSKIDTEAQEKILGFIADGKMMDAIKLYREQKGGGLKQAKTAVEEIEQEKHPDRWESGVRLKTAPPLERPEASPVE